MYYHVCKDYVTLGIVETIILRKLNQYREQANRDRFILPFDKDINFFIDTIKECVNFIK